MESKQVSDKLLALKELAKRGDATAQFVIGWIYYFGEGVSQDYTKAFQWFSKAAKRNHSIAQTFLGSMYKKGRGVDIDCVQADFWFNVAASSEEIARESRAEMEKNMSPEQIEQARTLAREWLGKHKSPNGSNS